MIFCSRCGHENTDDARSCLSCGARFGGQDEAAPFVTTKLEDRATTPAQATGTKDELEKVRNEPLMAVGEKRNPLVVLILGFVTCYIYLFYWWYVTGADIKRALPREDLNPPLELTLNLLTCSLFSIFLSYKYPKLILEMQEKAHVVRNDTSLVSVLLSLFSLGPIACYVIQTDLNRIWETVESGE
ncbi:MAG TPA: DUF4234 domain-containing protein [Pyrinomonadaceae bacterium]|jgi:hypothetical protein